MRIHAGIWTALLAVLLSATPLAASAAPGTSQGQGEAHRSARAEAALDAAQDLFRSRGQAAAKHGTHARRTTVTPNPEHASLVLRDLALSLDDLDAADRKVARRLLARPTDNLDDGPSPVKYGGAPTAQTCSEAAAVCLHWVTDPTDVDAPPPRDDDGDGVPDWVEENQTVFEEVWQRIVVELGYHAPVSDETAVNHGPDGRTDIYLAELGQFGMYGYCTTDGGGQRAAFCVVDDDFAGFVAPPDESLRVTAAHEFFHAVQFGYSMDADTWLMEGTAAWVEDEVYDDINDNLQYLARSALSFPYAPLDFVASDDYNWLYGSWIWWRFLTEYFGERGAPDPTVVRQVWQRIAAGKGSLEALRNVLASRGTNFPAVFADFGAANRIARRWYDEGASYARFVAPAAGRFTLTKARRGTGWRGTRLDHLSSRHAVIRPGTSLLGKWRLRVDLDLPPRFRGSHASVMVHRRTGSIRWLRVRLDRRGDARFAVGFSRRTVSHVAISLTNASTRMSGCSSGTLWSCGGQPRDDGLLFAFKARAVR